MQKHFCAGSLGPYIYDDEDTYGGVSHPFYGEYMVAFISEGQGFIMEAPTLPEHVVRLKDLQSQDGSNLVLTNVPTFDPHNVGQIWNSGGTLKISAG